MKKTIQSLLAIAVVAFAMTACSDVPEPEGYSTDPANHSGGGGGESGDIKGDGSDANPFNIAGIINATKTLAKGQTTTEEYSTTGYVAEIDQSDKNKFNPSYGNFTFSITDDKEGTGTKFLVYRCLGLNKEKFKTETDLKVGDAVVVKGKVTNFSGTIEYAQGCYLTKLNDQTAGGGGGDTPTPTPTPGGDNLLKNGDFETWNGATPVNWDGKAGNATLAQSTDKHAGSYAVKVEGSTKNTRLSYTQITLKAGTYGIKFFAKAADADGASVRPGYVAILDDGSVDSKNYNYLGEYINDITKTTWVEVTATFTLDAQKTICLVIMNPKDKGSVLIDDYELTTSDGGIVDGGGESGGGESGGGESGGGATGKTGTLAAPLTVAEINAEVAAMPADQESTVDYYAKGKVCSVKYTFSAQYGTATFNISDDGSTTGKQFTCYGTYYMGNKPWVDGNTQIKVGDEVVVCGKVINYGGNTPEFNNKKNYLISLNGATE